MRVNRAIGAVLGAALSHTVALSTVDPSSESLRIEKLLKPISNELWSSLASGQLGDTYEIQKGDTLSDLSNRLFGDPLYWPKLWSINNQAVTNPHLIFPGQKITFDPGAFGSLPRIVMGTETPLTPSTGVLVADRSNNRSKEWKKLEKQRWEHVTTRLPTTIDPQGLDRRSLKKPKEASRLPPQVEGISKKEPILGEVWRAASASTLLATYDRIYIDAEDTLQVGGVYLVIHSYERLSPKRSGRSGYFLRTLGRVRIDSFSDNKYLATIIHAQKPITRGDLLIQDRPDFQFPALKAANQGTESIVTLDRELASYATAAYRMVILDRGQKDGIEPGMVCRTKLHKDPSTGRSLGDAPALPIADLIVIKANEEFSTALIRRSADIVFDATPCTFLTDISEFTRKRATIHSFESAPLAPLELEESLTPPEEKVLEQLEEYREAPSETVPSEPDSVQNEPESFDDAVGVEEEVELLEEEEIPEETPDETPEEPLEAPSDEEALDELLD